MKTTRKALITFLTMVIVLSLAAEICIISGGPMWLYAILMWIPALSAFVASWISITEKKEPFSLKKQRAFLQIRGCHIKYILLGVLFPLVYLLIPYMIYWTTHPANFGYTGVALSIILKDCLPMLIIGIFPNILTAMGEEIGWRGFLLPALTERMGLARAMFLTGFIWACWHLPILTFGDYMEGAPVWYKVPAFILCIVPVGIMTGYLTYKSKSVWPAAFLHAAHNNFDQAVFGVITRGEDKMYFVSETGCLTILCAWIMAVIILIMIRKDADQKVFD